MTNRIVSPQLGEGVEFEIEGAGELNLEKSLRPSFMDDYIGQKKVKENLSLFMEAARSRGDALDQFES